MFLFLLKGVGYLRKIEKNRKGKAHRVYVGGMKMNWEAGLFFIWGMFNPLFLFIYLVFIHNPKKIKIPRYVILIIGLTWFVLLGRIV